jgi:hypothetical protein
MFLKDEAARRQTGEGAADLLAIESRDASDVIRRRVAKGHGGDNPQSRRFGQKSENASSVLEPPRLGCMHRVELRRHLDADRLVAKQ